MLRKKYIKIGVCLFLLFIIYYFINKYLDFGIPCLFHALTGLYCPGCGITRMLFSLLELDFYSAYRANPLLFILLILAIIYLFVKLIMTKIFRRKIYIPNFIYYILIAILLLYGLIRNLPGMEFLLPYTS